MRKLMEAVQLDEGGWYDTEYEHKMKEEDILKLVAAIKDDLALMYVDDKDIRRIAEKAFTAMHGDIDQNPRFRQM